jgi:hypothetical protein
MAAFAVTIAASAQIFRGFCDRQSFHISAWYRYAGIIRIPHWLLGIHDSSVADSR